MLKQPEFVSAVRDIIRKLQGSLGQRSTEADVVHLFEVQTTVLLKDALGLDYSPLKESPVQRARVTAQGRIDSRIGNLIIEFKRPSKLFRSGDVAAASAQLESYLTAVPLEDEQIAVGFLTDGLSILRMEISSRGDITAGALETLTVENYVGLIRDVLALDRTRLTAQSLVDSFAPSDGPLFSLARVLFAELRTNPLGRTQMLFDEWQLLFKLAHDDQSKQKAIEARRTALSEALGVRITQGDTISEYAALFAIQTAYAIVLKLIASHLLNGVREGKQDSPFEFLATSSGDTLQAHMSRLEDGAIFRDEGFENLLEGDFFSWYADTRQWSENVQSELTNILLVLARYENTAALGRLNNTAMDLFKDLYMAVIPEKVRHNLGEFYTPPWLADHTLETALEKVETSKKPWRALDPCCGSGTFLTAMIRRVVAEESKATESEQLSAVLHRVVGIDLNPLAVLTARINYFINIAHLIQPDSAFEIPVYLGDASKMPTQQLLDDVICIGYTIRTIKGDLQIVLPASIVRDTDTFSRVMTECEMLTKLQKPDRIAMKLQGICDPDDLTQVTRAKIADFANSLVDLERQEWNGIWPRIVANFLTTANLGKFQIIAGNPPWIDWKNLPQHYRNSLVEICLDRHLFSGAGRTGGINLNICALITHVSAASWLDDDGVLAFLMPEPLIFQRSYEGFRRFEKTGDHQLYLRALIDWTEAGRPFAPVSQPFLTFVIGSKPADYVNGIPVVKLKRRTGLRPLRDYAASISYADIADQFEEEHLFAARPSSSSTALAYCEDAVQARKFRGLAGQTDYRGRDGIQLYPEDLYLFSYNDRLRDIGGHQTASFVSFQGSNVGGSSRSEHILETRYMRPVVKGTEIERFRWAGPSYYAPLPYDVDYENGRTPLPPETLTETSPKLLRYFVGQKRRFGNQSTYNDRIVGTRHSTEFYTFTRVGAYSHAATYVAFRHNTKWAAAVIETHTCPWGADVAPLFQSHALSICEGPNGPISHDEAHYIAAILNAPTVQKFIYQSSDVRSFRVQPPLNIPVFVPSNVLHSAMAEQSKVAHANAKDQVIVNEVDVEIERLLDLVFSFAEPSGEGGDE